MLGQTRDVDVIAEQYIYCKLRIKDVKEQLLFKCLKKVDLSLKRTGRSDLKMMISWNHREPTEANCEKLIVNVRRIPVDIFIAPEVPLRHEAGTSAPR